MKGLMDGESGDGEDDELECVRYTSPQKVTLLILLRCCLCSVVRKRTFLHTCIPS